MSKLFRLNNVLKVNLLFVIPMAIVLGATFDLAIKFYRFGFEIGMKNSFYHLVLVLIGCVIFFIAANSHFNESLTNLRFNDNESILNFAIGQIEKLEIQLEEQNPSLLKNVSLTGERWPWGVHHTELLGHLSAAAKRFWKLYDPSDIGTAPTNKEVSDWLVKERKISRTMADAMASMLRVDGLRTGPRE